MNKVAVFIGFLALSLALPNLLAADDVHRTVTQEQRPTVSAEALVAAMDDTERDYYYRAFEYAVQNLKPNERYDWNGYDSSGYFQVLVPFMRNDTICRSFKEYITHKKIYSIYSEGVGCKRVGREGWCKLKKGDLLSCALEPDHSVTGVANNALDDATRSFDKAGVATRGKLHEWLPF